MVAALPHHVQIVALPVFGPPERSRKSQSQIIAFRSAPQQ